MPIKPGTDGNFDKILLDVPCLGIGVIKRKPDIKWQRKKEDVQEIAKLQYKILQNCAKYLKEKGTLVYSTCSILKEENEDVISKFLQNNSNFTIEQELKIKPTIKEDGFYICKLKNRSIGSGGKLTESVKIPPEPIDRLNYKNKILQ